MTLLPTSFAADPNVHSSAAKPGQSRYGWLADRLRANILGSEWMPGNTIPAETQLAKTYNVALGTMRQAIAVLVTEGLLERVHGRGTFVSSGIGGASLLRFFRFRTAQNDAHVETKIPVSRIVEKRVAKASADIAAALQIAPRDPLLALTRIRSLAGVPCLFERIWLPLPRFAAVAALNKSQWDDLLYPMFQRLCGVTVHKAEDSVTFCHGETEVVRALNLRAHAPCARVERRAFDMAGRCVELRNSFGDALSFQYTAHLR